MNTNTNAGGHLSGRLPPDSHDWRNPKTELRAKAVLGKLGYRLQQGSTKAELLQDRNALRAAINDESRRADEAIASEKPDIFQECLDNMEALAALNRRTQNLLDCEAFAEAKMAERGMVRSSGADVRALGPKDRLTALSANDHDQAHRFGFGDYVRAMVLGTDNVDIRATLSEGTDSAGGYTVPTRLMREVIDTMRAQTVVIQAGAMTIPLDTQKTSIARLATDPAAAWRLENAAIAESDPTFEKVEFTARSLAVLVKVSRELLEDSSNLNTALTQAFAGSMAVEVDRVALFGTGTAPQPRGVFNTAGIGSVEMAVNGAALANWGKVLDTVLELKLANAAEPSAMVMAPRTWRTIAGFADTTGQPLRPPVAVEGVQRLVSTIVPITQTQGSASNASCIVAGDFSQMMLGVRTMLQIEVLKERYAENHQYAFVAHLRMDVQLARPKAFAVLKGIVP